MFELTLPFPDQELLSQVVSGDHPWQTRDGSKDLLLQQGQEEAGAYLARHFALTLQDPL